MTEQQNDGPGESARRWISGLMITLTTIVSYFAFWRLSRGMTFFIGFATLVALLAFLYAAGKAPNTPDKTDG